jgi:hypothetical protein
MLPVSGAEQLNTSADHGIRPITSHSGAYSRLVKPPLPCSPAGRKSSRVLLGARAVGAIRSMRSPRKVGRGGDFSATCSWYEASFVSMCSAKNCTNRHANVTADPANQWLRRTISEVMGQAPLQE